MCNESIFTKEIESSANVEKYDLEESFQIKLRIFLQRLEKNKRACVKILMNNKWGKRGLLGSYEYVVAVDSLCLLQREYGVNL